MIDRVPIKPAEGVEIVPTEHPGVSKIIVVDSGAKQQLSWDRYVRLKATADEITKLVPSGARVIDVGGYDGALALFLPEYNVNLIDPATTGGSLRNNQIEDKSYELAAAIDVLEHVLPQQRESALSELTRIAQQFIVLNYPCQQTKQAQQLVFEATKNALIAEHVNWELPDTNWVLEKMAELGFHGHMKAYGSVAVWLGQYLTLNLAPKAAPALNRYLIKYHAEEPSNVPLYHLVFLQRAAK